MWVKTALTDDGIELFWQVRTSLSGHYLITFDANGSIDSSTTRDRAIYPPTMRSAGVIPIDDAFIDFAGMDRFEDLAGAVMRHACYMLSRGYGENPEEVVSWFTNISELEFLEGTTYKIISECPPWMGMIGVKGVVELDENGMFVFNANVRDSEFKIPMDDDNSIISFIIASIPI